MVGGGDTALDTALSLREVADVTVVRRRDEFRAFAHTQDRFAEAGIEVVSNGEVVGLKGGERLESIVVQRPDESSVELPADLVLVSIGQVPDLSGIAALGARAERQQDRRRQRDGDTAARRVRRRRLRRLPGQGAHDRDRRGRRFDGGRRRAALPVGELIRRGAAFAARRRRAVIQSGACARTPDCARPPAPARRLLRRRPAPRRHPPRPSPAPRRLSTLLRRSRQRNWLVAAVARGLALFIGGFTLVSVFGSLRHAHADFTIWWVAVPAVGRFVSGVLLVLVAAALLGYARRAADAAVAALAHRRTVPRVRRHHRLERRGLLPRLALR